MATTKLLTVAEAAAVLRRAPDRVRDLVNAGRLRASRPNGPRGRILIEEQAVRELIDGSQAAAVPAPKKRRHPPKPAGVIEFF